MAGGTYEGADSKHMQAWNTKSPCSALSGAPAAAVDDLERALPGAAWRSGLEMQQKDAQSEEFLPC